MIVVNQDRDMILNISEVRSFLKESGGERAATVIKRMLEPKDSPYILGSYKNVKTADRAFRELANAIDVGRSYWMPRYDDFESSRN